ncbi:hypothetical protein TL16_g06512 [Triparma laevis f. inornata]|uniref:Uncharacterized protein n=1 Tax=Triparma laevis f. inornata TaxID=1714386 RepID=A0A9W7AVD1_9STRA|nr:hypothetical protein TL16_g06512 [Triparma laevis f. inornata]
MKTRAGLDEKYSLLTFEWHKLMPFFTAIVLSALPTIVKATKGESNILDATHSDADIAVDVMMSVFILFTMFFVSLAILKDASEELANSWRLVELLLRSIQPEDEPRKKVRGGEEESLAFRLDSSAAVEGFIALYKFIAGYVSFHNEFHIASFAMLSVICVASVIVSFIGSVLMFEIDVWNSYLMALAILIWPVVLTGLFHIVKIDELLNLRLKKYLRHQRRMNEKILRLGENHHSAEEGAKLKNVCEQIDQFIEEIDDTHKTIKLLGKLPLNKVNMIRLAGAMGAGIFTTIMRSAINLD